MHTERRVGVGRARAREYVVLSRACAELCGPMAALLADWPEIEVVVDRRPGRSDAPAYLAPAAPRVPGSRSEARPV